MSLRSPGFCHPAAPHISLPREVHSARLFQVPSNCTRVSTGASPGPSHSSVPARVLTDSHQSVRLCASRRVPRRTSSGSKCPHLSRDRLARLPRATCSRTDNSRGAPSECTEAGCARLPVCALRLHRPPSSRAPRKPQWSAPTLYRSVVISRTLTCSCRRPPLLTESPPMGCLNGRHVGRQSGKVSCAGQDYW